MSIPGTSDVQEMHIPLASTQKAGYSYGIEHIARVMSDALTLAQEHYEEVRGVVAYAGLDLSLERYEAIEEHGALRTFTVRVDGTLVGYATFLLSIPTHASGETHAHQDSLFLTKAHRRGGTGIELIRFCDKMLKAEGVDAVDHTVTEANDYSVVLRRLGYKKSHAVYSRRL